MKQASLLIFILSIFVTGCSVLNKKNTVFNQFLEEVFEAELMEQPEMLTAFGRKERYSELADRSEEAAEKEIQRAKAYHERLLSFDTSQLVGQDLLSYKLVRQEFERQIQMYKWRHHSYPITSKGGDHTELPMLMLNYHKVKDVSELEAYISRLKMMGKALLQTQERMQISQSKGVLPPKFMYKDVITVVNNMIQGQPFESSKKVSPLYKDFQAKLEKLKLSDEKSKSYLAQAREALIKNVKPAYLQLLKLLRKQERLASQRAGIWKVPNGEAYYKQVLKNYTTTDLTPDEIHEIGLKGVARLRADMLKVAKKLGHKGDLASFFTKVRSDSSLYFPNTPSGEAEYLKKVRGHYADIMKQAPKFFNRMPKADFEIRPVEKFRQASSGIAFYNRPAEDGSRPGIYYVNTKDMKNLPVFEAEAILYHEGTPGHHFQIALTQEIKGLPQLRKYIFYTAYVEGWGLYSERLAKEMGGYQDNYAELGRLSAEMLRAARLVVDTGLHAKKWSRKKATDFFDANVPATHEENQAQIDRYILWPGQATAYMVGMLKIFELREKAKKSLGNKFDIRSFHDVVLENGPLPLNVLESLVDEYIAKELRS